MIDYVLTYFFKTDPLLHNEVLPELKDDDAAEHVGPDQNGDQGEGAHVLVVAQGVPRRTQEHKHKYHHLQIYVLYRNLIPCNQRKYISGKL